MLSLPAYEQVRAHPGRFLLCAGHESDDDLELIVEAEAGYGVVEKLGEAGVEAAGLFEGGPDVPADPFPGYPSAARSTASVSPQSGRMNGVPCTVHAIPYQTSSVPDQRRILIVYVSPRTAGNSAIS
jgi:hypothetical protein